ncbi:anaerobic ribonucleoside-triphosphate reductase activating protein [Altererythrobacter aquaemixtae]|uniref:Anaerobic ribonucleoside-triphosphate reductase activating protein n=1 Tax=Pontixanthobacter aquaemixtae TaxID=1958940 RepID=A0A845A017_9SPHN|nr:anaerobic ribonucleoside-triphosphate reductase activating protein [Pontixanthobacter aquaemixtae]
MGAVAPVERNARHGTTRVATPFYAVTPFTMLDFPDRIACILWIAGCNMRCGYCHNPQIVLGRGSIDEDRVIEFLTRRKGLLDGVVFSGGEATSWKHLARFAAQVKSMGFAIKLDTNGLRPDVVQCLLDEQLVDRIALDYKAPQSHFHKVTGVTAYSRFSATLDLLCTQGKILFDVRTTVHTDLLDEEAIVAMANDLFQRGYRGVYAIQSAVIDPDRPTLDGLAAQSRPLDMERLRNGSPLQLEFR